jgi:hypothetical protein
MSLRTGHGSRRAVVQLVAVTPLRRSRTPPPRARTTSPAPVAAAGRAGEARSSHGKACFPIACDHLPRSCLRQPSWLLPALEARSTGAFSRAHARRKNPSSRSSMLRKKIVAIGWAPRELPRPVRNPQPPGDPEHHRLRIGLPRVRRARPVARQDVPQPRRLWVDSSRAGSLARACIGTSVSLQAADVRGNRSVTIGRLNETHAIALATCYAHPLIGAAPCPVTPRPLASASSKPPPPSSQRMASPAPASNASSTPPASTSACSTTTSAARKPSSAKSSGTRSTRWAECPHASGHLRRKVRLAYLDTG